MITRVTGSALELLSRCQYWAREGIEWNDDAGDDAALGSAVDAFCTAYISRWRLEHIDDPRARAIASRCKEWIDEHHDSSMRAQVVFAYDPVADTGREIETPKGAPARFYALPFWREKLGISDREICTAVDILAHGIDSNGVPVVEVYDWKVRVGLDVKDATAQLNGGALFAARAFGVSRAFVATLVADEARVDGRPRWLDAFDLDAMAGEIASRVADIPTAEPQPGEWCTERYCKALAACPAKQADVASAEQLVPVEALVRRDAMPLTLSISSPDHAANILERTRAIEKVCKQLRAAVDAYVGDGCKLSDGSSLQPTYRNMPRVPAGAFEALARRLGATDEDIALCVTTVRESAGLKVVKPAKKSVAA